MGTTLYVRGRGLLWPILRERGRSQIKRYQYLLTCLTVRAVHIEKLDTLDADTFMR